MAVLAAPESRLLYIDWEKIDTYTKRVTHTFLDNKGRYYELVEKYQWKPLNANKHLQCQKPS